MWNEDLGEWQLKCVARKRKKKNKQVLITLEQEETNEQKAAHATSVIKAI